MAIDYIGVVNIHQAPRFSLVKVSGEHVIYYDTPFYDVVRCNVNKDNETFKVIKNQKYDNDHVDDFSKWKIRIEYFTVILLSFLLIIYQ